MSAETNDLPPEPVFEFDVVGPAKQVQALIGAMGRATVEPFDGSIATIDMALLAHEVTIPPEGWTPADRLLVGPEVLVDIFCEPVSWPKRDLEMMTLTMMGDYLPLKEIVCLSMHFDECAFGLLIRKLGRIESCRDLEIKNGRVRDYEFALGPVGVPGSL